MIEKVYPAGDTLITETFSCEHLIIDSDAVLRAPDGKYLTLTVDGATKAVLPGEYQGDITLSVASYFVEDVYPSVNRGKPIDLETAVCVVDGKVLSDKSVPAAVHGGRITGPAQTISIWLRIGRTLPG